MLEWIRFFHLVAAAVWTGGLIVLAASVMALRRAGADRELLRALARQFSRVSWAAMFVAIVTGIFQVELMGLPWIYGPLHMKMGMVGLAVLFAGVHQLTATRTSARTRGMIQGVILLVSLGIYFAAVRL